MNGPSVNGRPRRVLLVEVNEDGTAGGSHQCLYDLVRCMDRARYEPVVLFYQHNRFVPLVQALGVETHVWEDERRHERIPVGAGIPRRMRQVRIQLGAIRRRARFLRRHRIDLLHLNTTPGISYDDWLPAARLARVPCITHARIFYAAPQRRIWRWLSGRFDRVISMSEHMADLVAGHGVPRNRIVVVYEGIDADALRARIARSAADVRCELGVPEGSLLAVMAGHLRPWKGQNVVLRALAMLPPELRERLVVAFAGGPGSNSHAYIEGLHATVSEHGLEGSVRFLGERTDVPDLMHAADIVLHASTVPEPFGLVILEGMVLGKPVIASGVGGPVEIITPGSALTFDPTQPEQLANLLARLVEDPAEREALGTQARERAGRFAPTRASREMMTIYDEVLSAR